jgi:hypothetical protein
MLEAVVRLKIYLPLKLVDLEGFRRARGYWCRLVWAREPRGYPGSRHGFCTLGVHVRRIHALQRDIMAHHGSLARSWSS